MYACIYIPKPVEGDRAALKECSEAFSPNVEWAENAAILDIRGLRKLYGPPECIGKAIAQRVESIGARVAIASNPQAAMLAARGYPGLTVIPAGEEGRVLASLPLPLLAPDEELQDTLASWGIRTFADLAALPESGIADRLGEPGVRLHRLAGGFGERPIIPAKEALNFEAGMELDHPLELLEPLLFLLSRLLNEIFGLLRSNGLAANEMELRFALDGKSEYVRAIRIPFATRDAQTFLKLIQYDLSAHPPGAPVIAVHLKAIPVHPRHVQGGLFIPLAPQPEKLELTLARIAGIVGEGNAGMPELLNTHKPGAFRMVRFIGKQLDEPHVPSKSELRLAIRIYRPPRPASVIAPHGKPEKIRARGVSGSVAAYAGPWRTSGDWFTLQPWAHDEWDIALECGGVYRLRREASNQWFVDGNYD